MKNILLIFPFLEFYVTERLLNLISSFSLHSSSDDINYSVLLDKAFNNGSTIKQILIYNMQEPIFALSSNIPKFQTIFLRDSNLHQLYLFDETANVISQADFVLVFYNSTSGPLFFRQSRWLNLIVPSIPFFYFPLYDLKNIYSFLQEFNFKTSRNSIHTTRIKYSTLFRDFTCVKNHPCKWRKPRELSANAIEFVANTSNSALVHATTFLSLTLQPNTSSNNFELPPASTLNDSIVLDKIRVHHKDDEVQRGETSAEDHTACYSPLLHSQSIPLFSQPLSPFLLQSHLCRLSAYSV